MLSGDEKGKGGADERLFHIQRREYCGWTVWRGMWTAGLSPLRFSTTYHVTQEYYDMVKKLAEATDINAYEDYGIQIGYVNPKPEGVANLGKHIFKLDTENSGVKAAAPGYGAD
ncbi:MAG: hypothetical protein V8Q27_06625 [Eubacteriales bacterium]